MNDQVSPAAATPAAIRLLADQVLARIPALLDAAGKFLTEVQQQKLDSHVLAMARRSLTGEGAGFRQEPVRRDFRHHAALIRRGGGPVRQFAGRRGALAVHSLRNGQEQGLKPAV